MKCPQCGAEVAGSDTFCGSCGSPVAATASGTAAAGATPPPPPGQYGTPPGQFTTPPGQYQMPPPMAPPVGAYGATKFADPATGVPLAEWWQRVVALIIDGLVVGIPFWILFFIFGAVFKTTTTDQFGITHQGIAIGALILLYVIAIAAEIAYYVYLNGGDRGQTLGKMAMGIATRDESGTAPLGYGRAALRWLVIFALSIACGIPVLIDYLSPLWDPRRQSWHDKAAHSVVVTTK